MRVFLHESNHDWYCEIEIESRPQIGDGIYLGDFDDLDIKWEQCDRKPHIQQIVEQNQKEAEEEARNCTSYEVSYVAYGKHFGDDRMMWVVRGNVVM